jgi:uncharacterized protein (PEP-CTERM system associated)
MTDTSPAATLRRRHRAWRARALAGTVLAPLGLAWAPLALAQDPGALGGAGAGAPGDNAGQEVIAPPLPGVADTLLPRSGFDADMSDLRDQLLHGGGGQQPGSAASGPALRINTQFGLSEEYTSNVGANGGGVGGVGGVGGRGYDFITYLQPRIAIADTTQRLQANLDYQPTGQIYARNGDFSQFQQQGDASLVATAVPGWLYVDLRGSISQQSVYGGLGPPGTVTLSPNNRETVSSVSASPYVTRTLGTAGTVQLGASYAYSAVDAPGQPGQANPLLDGTGAYGNSYLSTERVFASYVTGENLGRLRNKVDTEDSFSDGSGALRNSRRDLLTDDVSYAVTRLVTLLAEAGYEDLSYPESDFTYSGAVGAGGVKLTPRRGSSLTVEYRYMDGFGSAFVQGSVQATPRIRVFGGYSAGISTFQQDVQNTLLDGGDDATGVAASGLQAGPLLSSQNAFAGNQNLNRTHRLDASASYLGNRDTLTLSLNRQTTDPVGRQVGTIAPISTSGTFASLSETHELTPLMSLGAYVQFGSNSTGLRQGGGAGQSGRTVSFSVSLNRTFSETLSGYVRVGGSYTVGGSQFAATGYQGGGDDTTATVGALKRF